MQFGLTQKTFVQENHGALLNDPLIQIAIDMATCPRCLRSFVNSQALAQRQRDTGHTSQCTDCGQSFKAKKGLSEHIKAGHFFS
jgi:uncharacterized C2H2 Zn-finger protein